MSNAQTNQPKPDETQALIAKLRLFGNNIPDSENVETELDNIAYRETFLKAADALARDHAIVERVTALMKNPGCRCSDLRELLTPPAEQPPRSEPDMRRCFCGDTAAVHIGQHDHEFSETAAVATCVCRLGPFGPEICAYHQALKDAQPKPSPDRSAAKCDCGHTWVHHGTSGCLIGRCLCRANSRLNEPPTAQPKPSPDRSAIVADLRKAIDAAAKLIEALS